MRARDIAKAFIFDHGFRTPFTAEDGKFYNDSNRSFTDGQLAKVENARQGYVEQIGDRWKIDKKKRKPVPRASTAAYLVPPDDNDDSDD